MDLEIGTKVIETAGFFKGVEFSITGEYSGTNPIFGDRKLISPRVPAPKRTTDVQRLLVTDPEALAASKEYGPFIYIYCQPSFVHREASRGGFDPKYIKSTSELSHGAKYDILFGKPVPTDLMNRLAMEIKDVDIVNNRICSRNLALWLIDEGVMPELPSQVTS
jgi:hypothetical protein